MPAILVSIWLISSTIWLEVARGKIKLKFKAHARMWLIYNKKIDNGSDKKRFNDPRRAAYENDNPHLFVVVNNFEKNAV
jgi:hypothetical protein